MKITIDTKVLSAGTRKEIAGITDSNEALAEFARDEHNAVRAAVARNPITSEKILSELAKDEHWFVIESVAKNPSTSIETLLKSIPDREWSIIIAALENWKF